MMLPNHLATSLAATDVSLTDLIRVGNKQPQKILAEGLWWEVKTSKTQVMSKTQMDLCENACIFIYAGCSHEMSTEGINKNK